MQMISEMKWLFLYLLVLSIVSSTTFAFGSHFDFVKLRDLINSKNIESIESLLASLPEEYKLFFTLVYSSKSAQGATPENPRAILFGRDGKLILTFNGSPTQRNYN